MTTIKRRIAALEQSTNRTDAGHPLVYPLEDENDADALVRSGYSPNAGKVLFIRFVSPAKRMGDATEQTTASVFTSGRS